VDGSWSGDRFVSTCAGFGQPLFLDKVGQNLTLLTAAKILGEE